MSQYSPSIDVFWGTWWLSVSSFCPSGGPTCQSQMVSGHCTQDSHSSYVAAEPMMWLMSASLTFLALFRSDGVSYEECPRATCPNGFLRIFPHWSHCSLVLAQRNPVAFVLLCEYAAASPALSVLRYFSFALTLDHDCNWGNSNNNIPWISVWKQH